ncbi:MAG: D-alanine--D-alanine ligase family protein [Treponema sp.]|uniref:D-alanine--D-alanine ligase family protein n=1 Tax=Treponema sp. TaxID=166 RepID=UPI003FA2C3D5
MNIAVVYGGRSGEHEVSLVSASFVTRAIGTEHTVYLIGITKEGEWYLQPKAVEERIRKNEAEVLTIERGEETRVAVIPGGGTASGFLVNGTPIAVDVVFPVLHGSFGEDGTIQGLFEMADLPYIGGGVLASSAAMDKEKTKIIWQYENLPVVPFLCVRKFQWDNPKVRENFIAQAEKELEYPLFVKPCRVGSSVGAGKAADRAELLQKMQDAFLWDSKVLIEMCIAAREIECSVTGNDECVVYTPGEIIPSHEFYDYDAKYLDPNGAQLKIPADIDDDQRRSIRNIARKAYQALDLTGLARVDFFIDKNTKSIYVNEVNTIPGFTAISMFPKMCEASGLPYKDLIMHLFDLAIERFHTARLIKTDWKK